MKAKLVFDTNVYIAAVVTDDAHVAQFIAVHELYDIYCSIHILDELSDKLIHRFGWEASDVARYLESISLTAHMVYPSVKISDILVDEDDHKILECALEAKADLIITADKLLLKIKKYQNIAIAHPSMMKYWFPAGKGV